MIIYQKNLIFSFFPISHLSSFFVFCVLVIIYIVVKDIGHLYKYNRPRQSTPTFKKPVLSSSAAHASSAGNSAGTSISSQLDNKNITTNKNKNNTSNIDDIHSCVTPRKQNYSVQYIYITTYLTPLNTTYCICWVTQNKTITPVW